MVVDAFTFFNELDLLEIRLAELNDHVDFFVLVEAGKTQSLLPKPLFFDENKERYAKYLSKIIHVKVEDYPDNKANPWQMENHQRNCIMRGLEQINLQDDDMVLVSDLDEIPKGDILEKTKILKEHGIEEDIFAFSMGFYAYYLNLKCSTQNWVGTVAAKYRVVKSETPQGMRAVKDRIVRINDAGWHFSWLGGAEAVWRKAQSCIEPFDKSTLPTKEEYVKFFEQYSKFTERGFVKTEDLSMTDHQKFGIVKVDENFPAEVNDNQDKYGGYLLK